MRWQRLIECDGNSVDALFYTEAASTKVRGTLDRRHRLSSRLIGDLANHRYNKRVSFISRDQSTIVATILGRRAPARRAARYRIGDCGSCCQVESLNAKDMQASCLASSSSTGSHSLVGELCLVGETIIAAERHQAMSSSS